MSRLVAWLRRLFGGAPPEPARPPVEAPAILPERGTRVLLSVGVNHYLSSPANMLRGCVNDTSNAAALLWRTHVVQPALLNSAAIRTAVLEQAGNLAAGLRSGDVGVLQLSGHGVQADDTRELDGTVEAFCPTDAMLDWPRNLLTAWDLADVCRHVREGALLLIFPDCCHGWDTADAEQYRAMHADGNPGPYRRARRLAAPRIARHGDARPRSLGHALRKLAPSGRIAVWTACRPEETAADTLEMSLSGLREYQGAHTWAALRAIATHPGGSLEAQFRLAAEYLAPRYRQRPDLYAAPETKARRLFA